MRLHNIWTSRQDEVLLDCKDSQNMTWKNISKRIGKTEATCRNRYNKLKQECQV